MRCVMDALRLGCGCVADALPAPPPEAVARKHANLARPYGTLVCQEAQHSLSITKTYARRGNLAGNDTRTSSPGIIRRRKPNAPPSCRTLRSCSTPRPIRCIGADGGVRHPLLSCICSAGTWLGRRGACIFKAGVEYARCRANRGCASIFAAAGLEIVAFDAAQARLAEEGMIRFGKGRGGEPAVLNVGDLFAYALARHLTAPLLFTGRDFTATDVTLALPC